MPADVRGVKAPPARDFGLKANIAGGLGPTPRAASRTSGRLANVDEAILETE